MRIPGRAAGEAWRGRAGTPGGTRTRGPAASITSRRAGGPMPGWGGEPGAWDPIIASVLGPARPRPLRRPVRVGLRGPVRERAGPVLLAMTKLYCRNAGASATVDRWLVHRH